MLEHITSRDNERVKLANRIAKSAAARAENGLFFAEGLRLCIDLAATLRPAYAFFTQQALASHPELEAIGESNFLIAPHVAQKLGETNTPQGLFCLFPLPTGGWQALQGAGSILVCERVQDPANIGAMLRSAAAFGFGGAVLTNGCADPFSPKAMRASVGACARLPLVTGVEFSEAAEYLRGQSVQLWAASLQNAQPLGSAQPARPFALCIGNEGAGLSSGALEACDKAVYIPMQGGVESLNAAVAASVLMFHFSGAL